MPGGKVTEWPAQPMPVLDAMSYDASRELAEESSVQVPHRNLWYAGAIYVGNPLARVITLYCCETNGQIPKDSDEVTDWAYYNEPPYDKTPSDYGLWLPSVIAGKLVIANLMDIDNPVINVCDMYTGL